jgi:hypothetical protein
MAILDAYCVFVQLANSPQQCWSAHSGDPYLGLFENPANAHEKYIGNGPVANAIAHGSGILPAIKGVT